MRRLAARAHLWGGLLLGPVVLIFGLSGAALVFRDELDEMLGGPRVVTRAGPPRALDAVVAAALFTEPGGQARALRIPAGPGRPYLVEIAHGARRVDVAVDPVTLRVVDSRAPERSVLAAVYSLHAAFHAGRPGAIAVALVGVAIVLESVAGIWLYGPRLFRRAHGARGRSRRLHRVVGGVSLALGLVLGLTGVALALAGAASAPAHLPPRGELAGLDTLAARAAAAVPGARLASLTAVNGIVRAEVRARDARVTTVLLERDTARVVASAGGVLEVIRRLHYGDFAGWLSRGVWALAGVALAVLTITGYLAATRAPASS